MQEKAKQTIFISTAIDYVNAHPHIGHAVEKLEADTLARWYRTSGQDVYFLSGTDENSLKNVQAAKKAGKEVKTLVGENTEAFYKLKEELNLSYDGFIRTTEKRHFLGAQKLWSMLKKEDIYKKNYKGLYCVGCEEFKLEKDLVDGKCPDHNQAPEAVEEENYFFRLSNYQDKIKELIQTNQLQILPSCRKNEVLSFIDQGLEDFSISRSKERAENWGVPVPGDESQIMYVWVDALSNYITALDFDKDGELYKKYWQNSDQRIHVIGKGILRFHAIYWIGLLLSAGLPLPTKILVHEYLTIDGQKISKTLGNVINPNQITEKYGKGGARYILLSSMPYTKDGDISWEKMNEKYNADLANNLGNLISRTISMINRYNIIVSHKMDYYSAFQENQEADFLPAVDVLVSEYVPEMRLDGALDKIWTAIRECNVYIDQKQPWQLAKEGQEVELERVLNVVYFNIKRIADLLKPFLPDISAVIAKRLEDLDPTPVFPRID